MENLKHVYKQDEHTYVHYNKSAETKTKQNTKIPQRTVLLRPGLFIIYNEIQSYSIKQLTYSEFSCDGKHNVTQVFPL